MRILIIAVGLATLAFAGVGFAQPERMARFARSLWQNPVAFYVAVALRLVVGVALITIAPATRFPDVFYVLGLITVSAAIIGMIAGADRLGRFLEWWLTRPQPLLRAWALFAAAFGAFLVYGVA